MKKRKVPPSTRELKSTAAAPLAEQSARVEDAPVFEPGGGQAIDRIVTAVRQQWRQLDWSLVWMILAVKAVIFIFGVQSYLTLMNKPIGSWYGWLEMWNRWDSLRHLRLAEIGYSGVGSERADLIGFPLYPWLTWLFSFVFQNYLISALIVSGLALIAAGLLLHKLVLVDFPDSAARNAVWFMLIFPTAHFLHVPYNESLFIALAVGCFLAARQGSWALAGILSIFLCMARFNGMIIVPALMMEALLQHRQIRRWQWQWLWIATAPIGFAVYLLINQYAAGDALAFLTIGRENFHKSLSAPWDGIREVYKLMWSSEVAHAQIGGVQEFTFIVLATVSTIACAFWLRASYTVWMAGNWFLFMSSGFIISTPRYVLAMFPIYILFARLAEGRRVWYSAITVWSLLFLGLFVSKFVQGHWTF